MALVPRSVHLEVLEANAQRDMLSDRPRVQVPTAQLRDAVLLRLLERGYVLVAHPTPDAIQLQITTGAGVVHIHASYKGRREVVRIEAESVAGVRLEVAHRVLDLVERYDGGPQPQPALQPVPKAALKPEPTPAPAQPQVTADPSVANPAAPKSRGRVAVGAGVGLRLRQPEATGVAQLIAVAQRSGVGALVRAEVAPSSATRLVIVDTTISAGPSWWTPLGRRVDLGLALAAGVLVHRYRFGGEPARYATDFNAMLPAWLGVHVTRGFGVQFGLAAGVSSRQRVHFSGQSRIWSRDRLRVSATLGLHYDWGRR